MTLYRLQNLATIFALCFALGNAHAKLGTNLTAMDSATYMLSRQTKMLGLQGDLIDAQRVELDAQANLLRAMQ